MSVVSTSSETTASSRVVGESLVATPVALPNNETANGICQRLVFKRLSQLQWGRLDLKDRTGNTTFGDPRAQTSATVRVHDPQMYRMMTLGGSLSAAEAYIRGYWDSENLVSAMRILSRHVDTLQSLEGVSARILQPLRSAANWWRRNSRAGSRRNIAAHYDLSNEFFGLMLDDTMTYSSGVFPNDDASLKEASIEKYDRICRELQLRPEDHVIEVGCGWGGFAMHAAKRYGCRVTATTISKQQFTLAQQRIEAAGLADRIQLIQKDYRDLEGEYDKLVSIEMIEAVGYEYLDTYFQKCSDLLKPTGAMAIQAITIPDHRFDRYRKSVDFIRQYIFPGGFLPSVSAIGESLRRFTNLRVDHMKDFGLHYATTLAMWREQFWANIDAVRRLGFDERFIRTWHYYLCYCEAGFRERQIGVSQIVMAKPLYRG